MAKFSTELSEKHRDFIAAQKLFFVATAGAMGRVNLSPKGMDTFRVLGPNSVGYLDATGSGNETAAHLADNGRITFMFCSFDQAPNILRIYGRGWAVRPRDVTWKKLRPNFGPELPGERQLFVCELDSVQTSCGFSIPFFDYRSERTQLNEWAEKKGPEGIASYWENKNTQSIDGLPTGLLGP
jgi:Pyridoxamine 5'-phosphate oxidase